MKNNWSIVLLIGVRRSATTNFNCRQGVAMDSEQKGATVSFGLVTLFEFTAVTHIFKAIFFEAQLVLVHYV
ncbi:hypothetical protein B0H10DRAFT_662471 [Mycena sp. CBHHK59/15]|nr:hypothetical protein B0H10DRAFT_662471 [Mycena sp. CBHHK59/15]